MPGDRATSPMEAGKQDRAPTGLAGGAPDHLLEEAANGLGLMAEEAEALDCGSRIQPSTSWRFRSRSAPSRGGSREGRHHGEGVCRSESDAI